MTIIDLTHTFSSSRLTALLHHRTPCVTQQAATLGHGGGPGR